MIWTRAQMYVWLFCNSLVLVAQILAGGSAVHNCSLTMCLTPIRHCRWITDLPLISWRGNAFIQHGNCENAICVAPCTVLCTEYLHKIRALSLRLPASLVPSFYSLFLCTLCLLPTQATCYGRIMKAWTYAWTRTRTDICMKTDAYSRLFTFPFPPFSVSPQLEAT